jgi:hypothetical protein
MEINFDRALPCKQKRLDPRIWNKRSKVEVSINTKGYWKYFRADLQACFPVA